MGIPEGSFDKSKREGTIINTPTDEGPEIAKREQEHSAYIRTVGVTMQL